MVGKFNQLRGRRVLIASLVLGYGSLEVSALEIQLIEGTSSNPIGIPDRSWETPCLQEIPKRSKYNLRLAIDSNVAKVEDIPTAIKNYVLSKNYNPNKLVTFGIQLPLVYWAATLVDETVLATLLANPDLLLAGEAAWGDTPLHFAVANSYKATQVLLENGYLDINEFNRNGESPLFVAMKHNALLSGGNQRQNQATVDLLLTSPSIKINARDNNGRTILHTAVRFGEVDIVKQLIELKDAPYGEERQTLDINSRDNAGRTPGDYARDIQNEVVREEMQSLLADAGAEFGL
ncbi:MAG: ankyrin repeat domain-containing protein [Puniceicoccales bacterium]|jgi:hypothetical protein|nr:ankyrin repeat domain-containing protein [Puniceicoccales bacterium]